MNRRRSKQVPGAAEDPPPQRFSPQVERLWEEIPLEFRKRLLANVWCGKCADGTTIVDFHGEVRGGDLILRGFCLRCGAEVARHIEGT